MSSSFVQAITTVFVTIFRFFKRKDLNRGVGLSQRNPHPFGSSEWKAFADAQATYHEQMVLRIADLEAQVIQTTELADALQEVTDCQASIIDNLKLENNALRNGPDPEIYERFWNKLHTPTKRPAQVPVTESSEPNTVPGGDDKDSGPSCDLQSSQGRAAGREPLDDSGMLVSPKAVVYSRPLTLAEELESQLGGASEDDSEVGEI